jgi:hypothetical protein
MTAPTLRPPEGGEPPPVTASLVEGETIDLVVIARHICQRYQLEFPDERGRYGPAGNAWCVHDNQHLLNWAAETVLGSFDMREQVAWLAGVLTARSFPVERLARNLDIAADVAVVHIPGGPGRQVADVLTDAATFLRSGDHVGYEPTDG